MPYPLHRGMHHDHVAGGNPEIVQILGEREACAERGTIIGQRLLGRLRESRD